MYNTDDLYSDVQTGESRAVTSECSKEGKKGLRAHKISTPAEPGYARSLDSAPESGARDCGCGAGGCGNGFIAAAGGFAERFQAFRVGHKRGRLAVAQRASGGKRERDSRGGDVVRLFGVEHGVILPEGEVRVHDSAAELFDGTAHGVKAILRIGDEARERFRRVTDLVKKERHKGLLGGGVPKRRQLCAAGKTESSAVDSE